MIVLRWIQFLAGACCIIGGLIFCVIQMIGVFRFRYVLTRLHASAIGDTLGGGLICLGVLVLNGFTMASFKVILLLVFLWMTAPVASHMVAKLEVLAKGGPQNCCPVVEEKEDPS